MVFRLFSSHSWPVVREEATAKQRGGKGTVGCTLLLLARVNACWYTSGTVTSYWSTKKRVSAAAVQQSLSRGPRTWNSMADSSNLFSLSNSDSSLHSFTESASLGLTLSHTLSLSLPLCLSPPLFPRVLLSDDCCCCLVTITLALAL
jgi:hypothetical protein